MHYDLVFYQLFFALNASYDLMKLCDEFDSWFIMRMEISYRPRNDWTIDNHFRDLGLLIVIKESMFVKTSLKHKFIQEIGELWLIERISIQEIGISHFIDSIYETSWVVHEYIICFTNPIALKWTKEIQSPANRLIKLLN
jgi:hypothetical protein